MFDSGVGGLTVLRALRDRLPDECFIYLGDTARLPYGTKTPETVQRYSLSASKLLVAQGIKALVVACNTASAFALAKLQKTYPRLPVFGVVEPGADAACAADRKRGVLVLATESTVRSQAYSRAILARRPQYHVYSRPAPLLVALAEEGRLDGQITDLVIKDYLRGYQASVDTLLLGCTHFPPFLRGFQAAVGDSMRIVDSATTTADAVASALNTREFSAAARGSATPAVRFLATDGLERFRRLSRVFFGEDAGKAELVDI